MVTNPITVGSNLTIDALAVMMKANGIDAAPIVDSGRLVGMVTARDMARVGEDKWPQTQAREVMSKNLLLGFPEKRCTRRWSG